MKNVLVIALVMLIVLSVSGCDQRGNMVSRPMIDEMMEPDTPSEEEMIETPPETADMPSEEEMVETPPETADMPLEEEVVETPPETADIPSEEEALAEATEIALQMEEERLVIVANSRAEAEEAEMRAVEENIHPEILLDLVYERYRENIENLIQETCGITRAELWALAWIHIEENPKGETLHNTANGDKRADANTAWAPPIALEYLRLQILNPNSTYDELKDLFLVSVRNGITTLVPL